MLDVTFRVSLAGLGCRHLSAKFHRGLSIQDTRYRIDDHYCIVIGWPVMLVIVMPFIKALRRRGRAKFVYCIGAGLLIDWVLAALVFSISLGRADAKALYYPTNMAGGLTMFLAWMFYIVGNPQFPHVPPNGYAKTGQPK
jgi:hypothetical protein